MLVCFFCTLCEFIENCMGKSSGENSNIHTQAHTTHLYTHTHTESRWMRQLLQLPLCTCSAPLLARLVLHSSSLPHTHTHSHIVCTAKRSDYPPLLPLLLLLLGHTTPLACRALKSINSFWSCTNRDSLRFLSLHLPLSTYFYFLCAYFALFTAYSTYHWLTFLWHKSF